MKITSPLTKQIAEKMIETTDTIFRLMEGAFPFKMDDASEIIQNSLLSVSRATVERMKEKVFCHCETHESEEEYATCRRRTQEFLDSLAEIEKELTEKK